MDIEGKQISFEIDTGADVNIINNDTAKNLNVKLVPTNVTLRNYDGRSFQVAEKTRLSCTINNNTQFAEFHVVNYDAPCIIGLPKIEQFNLI